MRMEWGFRVGDPSPTGRAILGRALPFVTIPGAMQPGLEWERNSSPLRNKPRLRVDIPRSGLGGTPPHDRPGGGLPPMGGGGGRTTGMNGALRQPVSTPVTPSDDSSRVMPMDEMFSDVSPAAVLGDQIARMRIEQGGAANVRRPPQPRPRPVHHDRDEGIDEVVIDVPLDVSPYMEMFMRPAPASQGRVLCRVEVKPQRNGNILYELIIESSSSWRCVEPSRKTC
ncbi:hypothetical protein T492DRAFT_36358 [Pavlovales sp. CCMP2436]|nr:hypothetical protein T492DRAFT_36358 [Pavlovales sp. CCMP2436]